MTHYFLFMLAALAGRYGPEAVVWYWRRVRHAQAAQKPEHADGQWFADTTPTPPLPQAQIADAPVLNKVSRRSKPGRVPVRRNGR